MKCLNYLQASCSWLPQRYFMVIYILIGLTIYCWMRTAVLMGMTQMTFPLPVKSNDSEQSCPFNKINVEDIVSKAEFSWDQDTQHFIVQGYYYGYMLSNIPGGILADTIGGKSVLGYGFLTAAIVTILIPLLAKVSPYLYFIGRIIQGFGQGVVFPCLSSMVASWSPPNERATMTAIVQSGTHLGHATGFITSGYILDARPGWEEIFYISGGLGVVWVFGWYLFCYSSPAQHPYVSDKEKTMIESKLAHKSKNKPKRIPWVKILTSPAVFAVIVANYGHLWAYFTMLNEMTIYLNRVVNLDIEHSGILSAAPQLSMIPSAIGGGYLCDWLVSKEIMSITLNRKIFVFLSNALPVPFLIAASFAGCDHNLMITFFVLMMFFKGLAYGTLKTQPIDLSPNYAGILMGLLNGTGAIAGLVSPKIVPLFLTGDGTLGEWQRFFSLSGVIMIMSTFPMFCCGSGEIQPWNSNELTPIVVIDEDGGTQIEAVDPNETNPSTTADK